MAESAPSSLVVLLYVAQLMVRHDKATITTDRTRISAATGLNSPKTITRSMKALKRLNLIRYRVKTKTGKDGQTQIRFYVISLGKRSFNALIGFRRLPRKRAFNGLKVNALCPVKGHQMALLSKERGGDGIPASPPAVPQRNNSSTTPSILESLKAQQALRTVKSGGLRNG